MVKLCANTYEDTTYQSYFEWFSHPLAVFQKHSIEAVVNGHHFLACVPTASGKTLSGEFAIRHAHAQGKRSIFLSPLKALSNQKYYDFTQKYPEISFGISTGDIKSGATADCIIMTNEVFMNCLFNRNQTRSGPANALDFQMDIDAELGCVVFDEIHMINDPDRGNVLEKIIMMLPDHVQMVMLSGTLDNPIKFAEWVESCHATASKQVWVSTSQKRAVPLNHYGYVACTESFLKSVKDKALQQQVRGSTNRLIRIQQQDSATGKNVFSEKGYKEIAGTLATLEENQLFLKRKFVVNHLAQYLKENEMLPAIFFVFSRKQVETLAKEISVSLLEDDSKVPYVVRRECEQIVRRFPNHAEYLQLPEYHELVRLLESGVGIHHAGMLQVLREIVEFMLSKKYIKVLVCTSTFAAGLNFAIRSVVMTSLKIFNGNHEEYLTPQDYSQMGGRAGRLGIDTVGHVVHVNNLFPLPNIHEYREIMCGRPQRLVSKFTISYSMVLHLLKTGQTAHFHEFAKKSMICGDLAKQSESQRVLVAKHAADCAKRREYVEHGMRTPMEVCKRYGELEKLMSSAVNKRRKEIVREMQTIEESHRFVCDDLKSYTDYDKAVHEYEVERNHGEYLEGYIESETAKICGILEVGGFVEPREGGGWALTPMGKIAANIGEIHPLVLANRMIAWDWLVSFSDIQLIGLLSTFVDVRVKDDVRVLEPQTEDAFLKQRILEMENQFHRIQSLELETAYYSGFDYQTPLMFDLVDEMMEWARDCDDEHRCKWFLQEKIHGAKEISTGDFAKACMKIATIARELVAVCEQSGAEAVECMHKLTRVEGYMLKYIVSNQSLYI